MMADGQKAGIVTGAGSGIGRASAIALSRAGRAIVVSDIDDDAGAETVSMIEAEGGSAVYQHCDVSDPREASSLVDRAISEFGRLDCAHNNAGIGGPPGIVAEYDRAVTAPLNGFEGHDDRLARRVPARFARRHVTGERPVQSSPACLPPIGSDPSAVGSKTALNNCVAQMSRAL